MYNKERTQMAFGAVVITVDSMRPCTNCLLLFEGKVEAVVRLLHTRDGTRATGAASYKRTSSRR